jgi:eukaryotic-like serine/threonine-protein kinase
VDCLSDEALASYFDLELPPERAQELFAHIDTCRPCARLFFTTAAALAKATSSPSVNVTDVRPPAAIPKLGATTIGRYHVQRVLGMGGMGVVYAGEDPQLNRNVAIKLLRPDARASSSSRSGRLLREAQAMARLSHPNVVHVYEVGTFREQVFVVMELIEGSTLAEWLREEARDWRPVVRAFLQAGAGLEAAHAAGIVHRDFKPENVLVSKDGAIRVTDFGLARLSSEPESSDEAPAESPVSAFDVTITHAGMIVGTPGYMAPEQMRGNRTDARTDVFSFCVALYEALAGVRPFAGDNTGELRQSIEAGRITPPRRGNLPRFLMRAVTRGLRHDPDERYQSMSALLSALGADPTRRRRLLAGYAGVAVLMATAAFAYERAARRSQLCTNPAEALTGAWDDSLKARVHDAFVQNGATGTAAFVEGTLDGYRRDWLAMRVSACEATRLRGEQSEELLDLRMQCLDDRKLELGALAAVLAGGDRRAIDHGERAVVTLTPLADCADAEALRARTRLPGDPAVRARVGSLEAKLARSKALFRTDSGGPQSLALATEVAEDPTAQIYLPLRAEALLYRGLNLPLLDRLDEAVPLFKEAAAVALRSRTDAIAARAWLQLAQTSGLFHRHLAEALEWDQLTEAVIARLRLDGLEAERLGRLSAIYKANEMTAKAEEYARSYLALNERLYGRDDFRVADALDQVANAIGDEGQFAEAESLYRRALDILSRNQDSSFHVSTIVINLGIVLSEQHRFAEAEAMARRGLAVREKLFPPFHPLVGEALLNLSDALCKQHKLDEVGALLDRLAVIVERHPQECSDLGTQVPWLRGEMKIGQGHPAEGVALLKKALADPEFRPMNRGQAELDLARVFWASDHRRSLALARAAILSLGRESPGDPILVKEIEQWIAEHNP